LVVLGLGVPAGTVVVTVVDVDRLVDGGAAAPVGGVTAEGVAIGGAGGGGGVNEGAGGGGGGGGSSGAAAPSAPVGPIVFTSVWVSVSIDFSAFLHARPALVSKTPSNSQTFVRFIKSPLELNSGIGDASTLSKFVKAEGRKVK
jgi:hypothetical protein